MKTRLYTPVVCSHLDEKSRIEYGDMMENIGVDTVFIVFGTMMFPPEEQRHAFFKRAREHVDYFHSRGFEVGIWISTFGFGGPLTKHAQAVMGDEGQIVSSRGISAGEAFCPENKTFTDTCSRHLKEIAEIINPDLLMFDDEMCLSVRPGLGCFCEKHMELYREKFGEDFTREELVSRIFHGKNDKYRRGWLEVVGNSMRKFCRMMREAVDEVNPSLRIGFCAGFTSFDIEGADAFELTKILAGKNKPFLRLSGAPYWSAHEFKRFPGMRLNEVIEFVRVQEKWGRDLGIEIFSEDDTYPRPRYRIPANPCECYDIALRASGDIGSFKYLFAYDRGPSYELGYYKRHLRNIPLYDHINEKFSDKKTVGVKVYERMRKVADVTFPDVFDGNFADYETKIMETAFSHASHLLTLHGIPVTYDESDCAIAFGVNALEIDRLPNKLILDLTAAEILTEKGIDVGLNQNKDKSDYYEYDNGNTKFLVFMYNAYYRGWDSIFAGDAVLGYDCQKLLLDFIGRQYPYIEHEPGVYSICKTDGDETAVIFLNLCDDDMFDFDVHLAKTYSSVSLFGAEGSVNGNIIHIDTSVPAWGAFTVVLR